jgi:hypothetical protein
MEEDGYRKTVPGSLDKKGRRKVNLYIK